MPNDVVQAIDEQMDTSGILDPNGMLTTDDPMDEEDDDDTGGPDEETETGAIEASAQARLVALLSDPKLQGQIVELLNKTKATTPRGNPARPVTAAQVVKTVKTAAKPRPKIMIKQTPAPTTRPLAWRPSRSVIQQRQDMASKFSAYLGSGKQAVVEDGYLFATGELLFDCAKTATDRGEIVLKEGAKATFFTESPDDTVTRIGVTHKVTLADTNVRSAGRLRYTDEVMLIEAVSLKVRGIRVRYASGDITAALGGTTVKDVLGGKGYIFDDSQLYLPKELWRDNDGYNNLERVLLGGMILRFHRRDLASGGNEDAKIAFIDLARNVLTATGERTVARTAGGADTMEKYVTPRGLDREGFYWNHDLSSPDASEFSATITSDYHHVIAATPVDIGSGTPVMPEQISLELELLVAGTTIKPKSPKLINFRKVK